MRRTLLIALALAALTAGCSDRKETALLRSDADSAAYVIGLNLGLNLMRMDSTIRVEAVCRGIRDVFEGGRLLSDDEARTFYLRYVNYELPAKARAYEEQFLADFARSNRAYARTSSGVTYTVDEIGDQGLLPSAGRDSVAMRYVIRTADGREVYSSYERGDTLRMQLSDLPKGVQESLKLIGRSGRIRAWLPSSEAYGEAGDEQLGIAPNTTLFYEIELLDVDKYADRRR